MYKVTIRQKEKYIGLDFIFDDMSDAGNFIAIAFRTTTEDMEAIVEEAIPTGFEPLE